MATGHVRVTTHRRGLGHSVAAAVAYRWGERVTDRRTGVVHDYRRRAIRGAIGATGMASARPTPLTASPQIYADALESRERHPQARILRDLQIMLPTELDMVQAEACLADCGQRVATTLNTVTAWALHPPDPDGDERNLHGHIIVATRELDEDGQLGRKMRALDRRTTSGDAVARLRNLVADCVNQHLIGAGSDARMHVGLRLDGPATITLGAGATALERRAAKANKTFTAGTAVNELVKRAAVTEVGKALAAQLRARPREQQPVYAARAESRRSRWVRQRALAEVGDWTTPDAFEIDHPTPAHLASEAAQGRQPGPALPPAARQEREETAGMPAWWERELAQMPEESTEPDPVDVRQYEARADRSNTSRNPPPSLCTPGP